MNSEAGKAVLEGNFSAAVKILTALIESHAGSDSRYSLNKLYCNRAGCYKRMELYKHMLKDCERAIELNPDELQAYVYKGEALSFLKKKKELQRFKLESAEKVAGNVDLEVLLVLHKGPSETTAPSPSVPTPPPPSAASAAAAPPTAATAATAAAASAPSAPSAPSPSSPAPSPVSSSSTSPSKKAHPTAAPGNSGGGEVMSIMHAHHLQQQIQAGINQVNNGQYREGIELFDKILRETGPHPQASHIASLALQAHMGRGTARAMLRSLADAEKDFSAAIALEPALPEAWKRRGQTRAALNQDQDAVDDLSQALSLQPGAVEVHMERGMVHHRRRDYRRGCEDFEVAVKAAGGKEDPNAWKMLGLCRMSKGDCPKAIQAFKKCIQLHPQNIEAWTFMAQTHKELAQWELAQETFKKAIEVDPTHVPCYRFMGLLYHGLGRHRAALEWFLRCVELDPRLTEAHFMLAVCLHALGHHHAAATHYTQVLKLPPPESDGMVIRHLAFYQRECAVLAQVHLDRPLSPNQSFFDRHLPPLFKEAWCKKLSPDVLSLHDPSYTASSSYTPTPPPASSSSFSSSGSQGYCALYPASQPPSGTNGDHVPDAKTASRIFPPQGYESLIFDKPEVKRILELAEPMGRLMQYDCQGFLPNQRQLRMGGLAALHLAQAVQQQFKKRKIGSPVAGWRDMLEIVVQWRQISEPNDPVLWVDLLTRLEFEAGFGSHTPMMTGQTKVVRYFPNFSKAFVLLKEFSLDRGYVFNAANQRVHFTRPAQRQAIQAARDAKELYSAVDTGDFWLCTPCMKTRVNSSRTRSEDKTTTTTTTNPGGGDAADAGTPPSRRRNQGSSQESTLEVEAERGYMMSRRRGGGVQDDQEEEEEEEEGSGEDVMDGTRITLQKLKTPDGYELSIRTPCTPPRWKQFDRQLQSVWMALVEAATVEDSLRDQDRINELVLTFCFYWYNFMPLARGTAASGYITLLGLFLAVGNPVTTNIPKGVQVDWEAILNKSPDEFIASVKDWLLPPRCEKSSSEASTLKKSFAALPFVGDVFPTIRNVIECLNNDGWRI